MEAKYFDGKSSKAHNVYIAEEADGIRINFFENLNGHSNVNAYNKDSKFWQREAISSESFATGNKILLSYGDFPFERLEITGDRADEFMHYVLESESPIKRLYHVVTRTKPIKLVTFSVFALALVIYAYIFHLSPFVGEQAVKIIPQSAEKKVGEVMYGNMASFLEINEDKSDLLLEFFEECGFQSEYDIRIDYAESPTVNAFAVPGGQIVVFEGIIEKTESWDELAALMGHELAHVNQRHSFKLLARSISGYLILSVITGDVAGTSSLLIEYASQVNQLSHSRGYEKEADIVGLEYLKENNIRPQAMSDLFGHFADFDNAPKEIEKGIEFLSTHPLSKNRIAYIQESIESNPTFNYEAVDKARAEEIWQELKAGL